MKKLMIALMVMFSTTVSAFEMDCFTQVAFNGNVMQDVVGELTVEVTPGSALVHVWNSHDDSYLGRFPAAYSPAGTQDGMQSYSIAVKVNAMYHQGFCTVNEGK